MSVQDQINKAVARANAAVNVDTSKVSEDVLASMEDLSREALLNFIGGKLDEVDMIEVKTLLFELEIAVTNRLERAVSDLIKKVKDSQNNAPQTPTDP